MTVKLSSLLLVVFVLGAASLALGGCNTTEGFGKDVKSTGKAIEDEARENK
jgi:predicted small secreted protein